MSDELRTSFTRAERETIIAGLRDEYGDREFSDELILLECQDMWRKGCHSLEDTEDCRGCTCCSDMSECPVMSWEKRHPEYKDDELAKRLKALQDELRGIQRKEIDKRLAEERKTVGIRLSHSFVTKAQVEKAKQVLINRGIAPVVVDEMLNEIGDALLDTKLIYPGE